MDSKPIDGNTPLDDLHPARFLKVSDLLERWKVQSITVEIAEMLWESTVPVPSDIDPATRKPREVTQPILYFRSAKTGEIFPRGYLVGSKIDTEALKSATGASTVRELTGKRIKIMVGAHRGKATLRIDPSPVITQSEPATPGTKSEPPTTNTQSSPQQQLRPISTKAMHAELMRKADALGLLNDETTRMWSITPSTNGAELAGKIALLERAIEEAGDGQ